MRRDLIIGPARLADGSKGEDGSTAGPHCQAEVPVVPGWLNEDGANGAIDLYAIATGNDPRRPNYPAKSWLEREGCTVRTT